MRVSAWLQTWAKQAAEQLITFTVWRCVCNYLKQTLASLGPPHALRLADKIQG